MMLSHAASETEDHCGLPRFKTDEFRQSFQHTLFSMLSNGAGIEQDHIRLVCLLCRLIPVRLEQPNQELGIRQIHLATVRFDIDLARIHSRFTGALL